MNKEKVLSLIGEDTWDDFQSFMYGKGVGKNEDGSINYYMNDVYHFINRWPNIK